MLNPDSAGQLVLAMKLDCMMSGRLEGQFSPRRAADRVISLGKKKGPHGRAFLD
jgi:hypothetical protein